MIFPLTYLVNAALYIVLGYSYALLFEKRQTGAFLFGYTRESLFFYDFLRIIILCCILVNVLLNNMWTSILSIICFEVAFWIKIVFLKK